MLGVAYPAGGLVRAVLLLHARRSRHAPRAPQRRRAAACVPRDHDDQRRRHRRNAAAAGRSTSIEFYNAVAQPLLPHGRARRKPPRSTTARSARLAAHGLHVPRVCGRYARPKVALPVCRFFGTPGHRPERALLHGGPGRMRAGEGEPALALRRHRVPRAVPAGGQCPASTRAGRALLSGRARRRRSRATATCGTRRSSRACEARDGSRKARCSAVLLRPMHAGRGYTPRMPATAAGVQLVVAISSRALFDFEEENELFDPGDDRPYIELQLARLDAARQAGHRVPPRQEASRFQRRRRQARRGRHPVAQRHRIRACA